MICGPRCAVRKSAYESSHQPKAVAPSSVVTVYSAAANSGLAAVSGTVMSTGLALRASSVIVVFLVTFSFGWASQSAPWKTSGSVPTRMPASRM